MIENPYIFLKNWRQTIANVREEPTTPKVEEFSTKEYINLNDDGLYQDYEANPNDMYIDIKMQETIIMEKI